MKRNGNKWSVLLVCVLLIAVLGCSEEEETNTIPTPEPPTTPQTETFTPPPSSTPDPRIPDLTGAAPLLLDDSTNYTGLAGISAVDGQPGFVLPPLVGDPRVRVTFSGGRSSSVTGKVLLAFEDREGFFAAEIPSFSDTGYRTADQIVMIFADSQLVVRVVNALTGNDIDGIVYYRIRQQGEEQCQKVIVTCPPYFTSCPQPDTTTPCIDYMNPANAEVKRLGTFDAKYSDWVSQQ